MNMKKSIIQRIAIAGIIAVASMVANQAWAFPMSHYTQSSKLARGNWVKIKVSESGIYQITDADARNWGFSSAAALHVFGRGGSPMSETLSIDTPDDLPQVPVVRQAGKLLFYAQGPLTWRPIGTVDFVQVQHPYSTEAYYFVTDDESYKDIETSRDETPVTGTPVTTFSERLFHEKEITSPSQVGRVLLGEDFLSNNTMQFTFDLKGRVPGSYVYTHTQAGVRQNSSGGGGYFSFQHNGTNLEIEKADRFAFDDTKYLFYTVKSMPKTFVPSSDKLNYTIKYTNTNASVSLAKLNYVTVNYERQLALDGGMLCWGTVVGTAKGTAMAIAQSPEGTLVWDVTTPYQPVQLNTSHNASTTTCALFAQGRREYVAFNPAATFKTPEMAEHVSNQDLHSKPVPDMIIITHPRYRNQAQRVADLHEQLDSMRVLVVNQEEVFNEFSSGTPDMMALRQMCKFFYDHEADGRHHLQYVLLMGNGSFDNRQLSNEFKGSAFPALLTWQGEVSHTESGSYCTDECLAILKDNADNNWGRNKLDISVGRFPVKSEEEARIAVDKLYKYVTTPNYGSWRNNIIVSADDEENGVFMIQSDAYIDHARSTGGKDFIFKRVYLDAYEAQSVGSSRNYPGARDDLYNGLSDGVLMWTYNGHSNANVISAHNFVRRNDFIGGMYYKHLPLMFGTTCELARYDQVEESGAELMFLNKNGGAIAVISANRQALMDNNALLGNNFFKRVFTRDDDGLPLRLGEAFRLASNDYRLPNNVNYTLLGDPAMRLAIPRYSARIDAIDGKAIDPEDKPVFKARQTITFTGTIVDHKGNKVNGFNGSIQGNLYDCEQSVTTHGYGDKGIEYTYQEHSNRIALTSDSVRNGTFSIKVTIPSEIIYSYDNFTPSLINLYAYDAKQNVDAQGASEDFYIYGYDEDAKEDTTGPQILYLGLNGEDFKNGGTVNEDPYVFATVTDDSGINLSDAGIGHAMTLILDNEVMYTDVNKYYTPVLAGNGYKGTINYPLKGLSNGNHSLRLRVWDVFNNMSEFSVNFNVVNGLKPEISEVYATNNPANDETTFYVKHNRPDAVLNVGFEVYDLMGRLVWKSQQSGQSDMYTSFPVTWDLTDLNGNRVPQGIYVYRATVSTDGVREATKSKKLAVTGE